MFGGFQEVFDVGLFVHAPTLQAKASIAAYSAQGLSPMAVSMMMRFMFAPCPMSAHTRPCEYPADPYQQAEQADPCAEAHGS